MPKRERTLADVYRKRLNSIKSRYGNLQVCVDALAEELDATQQLCTALAMMLEKHDPSFAETFDAQTAALWDIVQPFGADDEDSPADEG